MPKLAEALQQAAEIDTLETEPARDLDRETKRPKLDTHVTLQAVRDKENEPEYRRKVPQKTDIMSFDALRPYMRNTLFDPTEPRYSSFIPSSQMMYHIVHHMDSIIAQNHHFTQSVSRWHPYVSRIYFGVIFVIQTARCQKVLNKLPTKDLVFLDKFLSGYPPESLPLPGPLVQYFRALCISEPHLESVASVYPRLPNSETLHKRARSGTPNPAKIAWLIPNIPELIGCANRLCSEQAKTALASGRFTRPFHPHRRFANPGNHGENDPVINGYNYSPSNPPNQRMRTRNTATQERPTEQEEEFRSADDQSEDDEGNINPESDHDDDDPADEQAEDSPPLWYFATPGLAYPLEAMRESEERFISYGDQIGLPIFTASTRFGTLEKFLGMEDMSWFSDVAATMSSYCKYFKASGNLSQCSTKGPASSQLVIDYTTESIPSTPPAYPGDPTYKPSFQFIGDTVNLNMRDDEAKLGFYTQLNVSAQSEHPFLGFTRNRAQTHRTGPYWESSNFKKHSGLDTNYLQIAQNIRSLFALDRPQN